MYTLDEYLSNPYVSEEFNRAGLFTSQDCRSCKAVAHEAWLGWVGSELPRMGYNEADAVRLARP